ncbi:Laminin subunit beta-1 [Bienertia sinuspersici]
MHYVDEDIFKLYWSINKLIFCYFQEKCSFDDPEYRRESVMKHAQRLFRDARSKLKRKYFNDTRLKTEEERLKNKPSEMTKIEWKFLVDHWSDEKFKEKSKKASESRAHQKMSHYNGTKSFARLRQEIRQKNEGKCSRVDVLVASRTRKSKKAVNVLALEKNTLVVKADQLIEEARKDAENARMEAEKAKKEAEAIRNDVDRKIEQNNAIWEKFHQLMNFIKGGTYSNDDVSGNESSS